MIDSDLMQKQLDDKLAGLMRDGIVTSVGITTFNNECKVFIGIGAQTDELAPDYSKEEIDIIRRQLRDKLRGIPFQIIGVYGNDADDVELDVVNASRPEGKEAEGKISDGNQQGKNDTDILSRYSLMGRSENQIERVNSVDIISFMDDMQESISQIHDRIAALERIVGIASLQARTVSDDLRGVKELNQRVTHVEKYILSLATRRFVVIEGNIILIIVSFLIVFQQEVRDFLASSLGFLQMLYRAL